jgi:glycosyltransferase involved in cell wall biosynthesis
MKTLLITNVVDLGTRSIATAYVRELGGEDSELIEIPSGIKSLGLRNWIQTIRQARALAKNSELVVCLHHGAIMMGSWFLPKSKNRRVVGIADWTRAHPSMRTGLYISLYNRFYSWSLKRLSQVFTISENLRCYYSGMVDMDITVCPLPFPETKPENWSDSRIDGSVLYVGAAIKRKAGDVLLNMWETNPPAGGKLSFVSPMDLKRTIDGVIFHTDIKAGTPAHRELFDKHEIFLLPTRRDSFGLAVLEAMNLGLVPVTTRMAGVSFLVEAAGCPVGATPEEAIKLAFELVENPEKLSECRKKLKAFMTDYPERFAEAISVVRAK